MLTDTHAHLYLEEFEADREAVIARALEAGVDKIYLPNIDSSSIAPMLEMEKQWPAHCFPMMGLHPCYVKEDFREQLRIIEHWLSSRSFCAIGEVGLDLHWDKSKFDIQCEALLQQVRWAAELDLPLSLHTREATEQTIQLLKKEKSASLRGVFHCFSGTAEQAREIADMGFCLGIGGVITYKNSNLPDIIRSVPLEFIVLETDAPYLAPVPWRGKRNESAYLQAVAEKISQILELDFDEISRVTTDNAKKIFKKK
jgi:TatD DNase family protein